MVFSLVSLVCQDQSRQARWLTAAPAAVVPALLLALLQPSWSAYVSSATVLRPNPQPRSAPVLAAVGTSGAGWQQPEPGEQSHRARHDGGAVQQDGGQVAGLEPLPGLSQGQFVSEVGTAAAEQARRGGCAGAAARRIHSGAAGVWGRGGAAEA